MIRCSFSLCLVSWFLISTVQAQTVPDVKSDKARFHAITAKMQAFVDSGELSGAVTIVGNDRGVLHQGVVGYQDLETKTEMTEQTLFRIASMTKPITTLAVMMLAEEGKLKPDDAVEFHLPEFKNQKLAGYNNFDGLMLNTPARPITIADLMMHTSGLPSAYPANLASKQIARIRTLNEASLLISQQPLEFQPGSKWSYCNAGIDVLGRLVEVKSGLNFEEFLRARIFEPLSMNSTFFVLDEQNQKRLATLYDWREGKLIALPRDRSIAWESSLVPMPAAGLFSTGQDLAKLYQCLLNGGKPIIRSATLQLMTKSHTEQLKTGFTEGMSFGYGFQVVKEPQGVTAMLNPGTFGHGGAFGTQGWIDPKANAYYIMLIQRTGIKNSDGSIYRESFQQLAAQALQP